MGGFLLFLSGIDLAARELALFAAVGFALLGLGDCLIDLLWIVRTAWRRLTVYRRHERARADRLAPPQAPGRFAIFIPAWDEAAVIGDMLRHALATLRHDDYSLYVGCYPNDADTIAAVQAVDDPRVRLVIGPTVGPTTKADCLNRLWQRMVEEEESLGPVKAIVLHDAEDVVHSAELRVFDRLIERFELVQLPVLPLVDPHSRWVAGHYIDEFCEAHGKELVVREWLGAALPSAGVGCAFARHALAAIAEKAGGKPFDADSLTEDYELGLRLQQNGGRSAFVRLRGGAGDALVVTREYFPSTLDAAVDQKARWITGIALAGWERLGWSGGLAERWMRLRDRRSVLAALFLFSAYLGLLLAGLVALGRAFLGYQPPALAAALAALLAFNAWLLAWRMTMRFAFVAGSYGWREGLRSIPRMAIANAVAILAARKAVVAYVEGRRTGRPRWRKTAHAFPAAVPGE